MQTRIFLVVAW